MPHRFGGERSSPCTPSRIRWQREELGACRLLRHPGICDWAGLLQASAWPLPAKAQFPLLYQASTSPAIAASAQRRPPGSFPPCHHRSSISSRSRPSLPGCLCQRLAIYIPAAADRQLGAGRPCCQQRQRWQGGGQCCHSGRARPPSPRGWGPRCFKGEGARTTNLGMAGDWGGAGGDGDPGWGFPEGREPL